MSEQTTEQTEDAPQEPQEPADTSQEPQDGAEDAQEPQEEAERGNGNREAAKYRTRLRAAEADLNTAREQVAALQAAAVARELDALAVSPEVFGLAHEPAEFVAEDGTVNRDALIEAAGAVREKYGLQPPIIPPYAPALRAGGERPARSSSWAEKLSD